MRRLAFAVLLLSACKPAGIRPGSAVRMACTLTVDGKVYEQDGSLAFKAGSGQLVPGLEEALAGLEPGDERTVTVPPEKGYGAADPKLVQTLPLAAFGALAKDLRLGGSVAGLAGGKPATGRVVALDAKTATLDFNRELAGKTLVFRVKILTVEP